jgi:hypothetical protein
VLLHTTYAGARQNDANVRASGGRQTAARRDLDHVRHGADGASDSRMVLSIEVRVILP